MSKKILRAINKLGNRNSTIWNKKNSKLKIKHLGVTEGSVSKSEARELSQAMKKGDADRVAVLIKDISGGYFNAPPLKIDGQGSIKSLDVSIYSSRTEDENLLHKLFDKVRA